MGINVEITTDPVRTRAQHLISVDFGLNVIASLYSKLVGVRPVLLPTLLRSTRSFD